MNLKLFINIRDSVLKARTLVMSVINASVKRKIKSDEIETNEEVSVKIQYTDNNHSQ